MGNTIEDNSGQRKMCDLTRRKRCGQNSKYENKAEHGGGGVENRTYLPLSQGGGALASESYRTDVGTSPEQVTKKPV